MFLINSELPVQVVSSLTIVLALSLMCILVGNKVKKLNPADSTPLWVVPFTALVDLINNFTKENLGKRYKSYAPYILTLGMFLFFSNISSIFLMVPATSYLVINFALAIISFFMIQITGIVSLGLKGYLKGFLGPVWYLSPLLTPINIIGELALPISLSLRLVGNIISGAVLSKLLYGVLGWWMIPVAPVFNLIFDIAFGTIQALVFVLLTVVFTSMKISDEEKFE